MVKKRVAYSVDTWYKNGETHRFHQQIGKQYS